MTDYLLCVVIALLAILYGEIARKQEYEKPVVVWGRFFGVTGAALFWGAVLFLVAGYVFDKYVV